jgi:hypothetical protein
MPAFEFGQRIAERLEEVFVGIEKHAVHAELDDGFHETGIDEASKHGTGSMLVDSSFQKI